MPVRRRVGEVPSALLLVDSRRWWNVSLGEVEKERLRDTSRCREAPLFWKLIAEEDILGVVKRNQERKRVSLEFVDGEIEETRELVA